MRYEVGYFTPEEFLCPCCGEGRASRLLVLWLDLLRRGWGGPLRVNSGYRCAAHNREVGGVPRSRHLVGCAADVAPVMPFYNLIEFIYVLFAVFCACNR